MQDSMLTMAKYNFKHPRGRKARVKPADTAAKAAMCDNAWAAIVTALQSVWRRRAAR